MTVLLNHTISGKIGMDVVTYVIFIMLLFNKILYNKILLYTILTLYIVQCNAIGHASTILMSQTFVGNEPCNCSDLFLKRVTKRH